MAPGGVTLPPAIWKSAAQSTELRGPRAVCPGTATDAVVARSGRRCLVCTLGRMTLGIVVFGAAFFVGLGLGRDTCRPLSTAFFVVGCFAALLMLWANRRDLRASWPSSPLSYSWGSSWESVRGDLRHPRRPRAAVAGWSRALGGAVPLRDPAGAGGIGRRDGFSVRLGSRSLEVRVLPPAPGRRSG